jgi:hypothetical protein
VRHQVFRIRKSPHVIAQTAEACRLDLLHADALHKVRSGKSSSPTRPPARWQDVIAAARIIAEWLR